MSSLISDTITNFNSYFNKKEFDFQNNSFDFIRLILALVVVVFHASYQSGAYLYGSDYHNKMPYYFQVNDWDNNYSHLGGLAVYGFFVLSGFLITRSALRTKDLITFFKNRIVRIYPGFLVSLLVTCFIIVPICAFLKDFNNINLPTLTNQTLSFFFRNLFIDTPVTKINEIIDWDFNGSLWTLLQEFRAYIIIGGLASLGLLKNRRLVLVITILLNLIYLIGTQNIIIRTELDAIFTNFRFFVLFNYFFVGASFYLYLDKIKWNITWCVVSILGIFLAFYMNLTGLFLPISSGYFILYLSQVLPIQNLTKHFGDMSYGVYIYGTPIQIAMFLAGVGKLGIINFTLISMILSLFAGYLSYHLVEKPLLSHRNKT